MAKKISVVSIITASLLLALLNVTCTKEKLPSEKIKPKIAPFPLVETGDSVLPAPEGVHPFYKKYINADGVVIVSSDNVPDVALLAARQTILFLSSKRPDVHKAMQKHHPRISVMAVNETASDLPEFGPESDGEWGLGQMPGDPTSLVSVKGICFPGNQHYFANALMHEYVHMLHNMGMPEIDPTLSDEIYAAYLSAIQKGQFIPPKDEPLEGITPFHAYGDDEYFTHAVNAFYDLNESWPGPWMDVKIGEKGPPSGTRAELKDKDPTIFEIISRFFPEYNPTVFSDCR
jgi:alpha-glucosidase